MKLSKEESQLGWWGLKATPEDYDATPALNTVWFDRGPRTLSPDRSALAGYLLFGRWTSGRLTTPRAHSPAVAQAIARDAQPVWLHTQPVELYAKPLPVGQRSVQVFLEGTAFAKPAGDVSPRPLAEMHLRRSDQGAGARLTFAGLDVSANAWLLAPQEDVSAQLRVALGCGVLFAEDLGADRLAVRWAGENHHEAERVRDLLSAVRLGLDIT